jgi:transcription-repair coupling factor (superfamily II helicase)
MAEKPMVQDNWKSMVGGARLGDLCAAVEGDCRVLSVRGMNQWASAYALARILPRLGRTLLLIASTAREARQAQESLAFFLGLPEQWLGDPLDCPLWHFPGTQRQSLGGAMVSLQVQAQRLATLYALGASGRPKIVVTSAEAAMEKVLPRRQCMDATRYFVVGERIPREDLVSHLVTCGYYRSQLVEEMGDFSVRGDIIDLFTPLYPQPLRLEFFGDTLESMRFFNPGSQRSTLSREDVIILPVHEVILTSSSRELACARVAAARTREPQARAVLDSWLERLRTSGHIPGIDAFHPLFYEELETIFHYLPPSALVVLPDSGGVRDQAAERFAQAERERRERWLPPTGSYLLSPDELAAHLERYPRIVQDSLPLEHHAEELERAPLQAVDPSAERASETSSVLHFRIGDHEGLRQEILNHPHRQRLLEPLALRLRDWQRSGLSPFLVCRTAEQGHRLQEIFADYDVDAFFTTEPFGRVSMDAPVTKIVVGRLPRGFIWPDELLVLVTEAELYGDKSRRRRLHHPTTGPLLDSLSDLQKGEFIVHVDHGIGIYQGLVHLTVGGLANDFLLLEYQDGDRLYLPVDRLHRVHRYLGIEGQQPRVERLGGTKWASTRKRVQESIRETAQELLQIYAMRQIKEGMRFSAPDSTFREFEASFPYEETPDQLGAIEDVLVDMQSARPMDRLICGDVGFGKTEVAVRAAFKAVTDGKQVAVLVPTTVLAEQHVLTFQERFVGHPVLIEALSRFKSRAEQQRILSDLRGGRLDIIIGTHRLLQRDVVFNNLGLLIIDEEHRFGVRHKERIKRFRAEVDALTLTATPIPRTLHMSLIGIRDLSTIDTPPEDRLAIETRICTFEEAVIREGIIREKARSGQVFFVHNNVRTIYHMAERIEQLVPGLKVGVAHGQLPERELEKVMLEFVQRTLDVLVCTTIIESGLDIPAANTIFINRADKLGLAQIYQLRGRVGRSSEQAYAYLIVPPEHLVTRQAQRRLVALMDFTELGSGFKIAMNDLKIRGAGNILGSAQSGHIAAVGYEMYVHLMEQTVRELKGEDIREPLEPEIRLDLAAHLPETYIGDGSQRLTTYRRLAAAPDEAALAQMREELVDRFGPLPPEAARLFAMLGLKLLLRRLWIRRLEAVNGNYILSFAENPEIDATKIARFIAADPKRLRLSPDSRLHVKCSSADATGCLAELKNLLQALE